jgi:aspartate aminotransferase-like enzyme
MDVARLGQSIDEREVRLDQKGFEHELLLTPGPVAIPRRVALAGASIVHHRSEEFQALLEEVDTKLKLLFRTRQTLLYFTASGTGAMEACVANLLKKGDRPLVVVGGKFGQRWAAIMRAYGIEPHLLEVEWGHAPEPEALARALEEHPEVEMVFTQLFETSTATAYDIEAIAKICREHGALLVVDAISGLGAMPLETDSWGVDVVVAGSQKALMAPPGLSFVSVSERAWERVERSDLPRFYFDFPSAREKLFFTPFTPAVSLFAQLNESLNMILEEGIEARMRRYSRYAEATRAAAKALGLRVMSARPGPVCTALGMPGGIDAEEIRKALRERFGIRVAGGQERWKGRVIRIAHIGDLSERDVLGSIGALELALQRLGHRVEPGSGVSAALKVLSQGVRDV